MFNFPAVTSLVALLCTGLCTVDASAIAARALKMGYAIERSMIVHRDVISPPIIRPASGAQWDAGSLQTVIWDTSVIPPGFNSTGMIVLGYLDEADGPNEHLDLDHPLATDFPITIGHIDITVPLVPTGDNYILVLFGDSGNASGKFTIKGLSISSTSLSSTATLSTSPSASSSTVDSPVTSSSDGPTSSSVVSSGGTSPSPATDTTMTTPTNPVPASSGSAAKSLTTQGSAIAASAGAPTASSSPKSAAYHSASPGGSWTYLRVVYVLGIMLGIAV